VLELKAKGQEKGEDTFDKHLAVAKELKIGRLVLKINGDSPVVVGRFGRCAHVVTPKSSGIVSSGDTMGVTYSNLKLIVKDSGDYHEIRWNVAFFISPFAWSAICGRSQPHHPRHTFRACQAAVSRRRGD
jgi:hypothetical protein